WRGCGKASLESGDGESGAWWGLRATCGRKDVIAIISPDESRSFRSRLPGRNRNMPCHHGQGEQSRRHEASSSIAPPDTMDWHFLAILVSLRTHRDATQPPGYREVQGKV